MSARPRDWHLFDGYDSDPVPADDEDVKDLASDMKQRATDAGDMKDVLKSLSDLDGWRGEAAEAFAEKAGEVLEDLGKAEDRYNMVADALYRWASDVHDAREDTKKAVDMMEQAKSDIDGNPEHEGDGDPPDNQDELDACREDAEQCKSDAQGKLEGAMSALGEAANRRKDEIGDAADIMEDGFWDDVGGWIRDNADLIATLVKVLEWVAIALAVAILVVGIFVTGGALLGVLIAVAVGIGLLTAGLQTMLVLADTGKADWGDVGLTLVGTALTLVGGKAAFSAVKGMGKLLPSVATRLGNLRTAAKYKQLFTSNPLRAVQIKGAMTGKMGPGMLKWGMKQIGDMTAISSRAGANLHANILKFASPKLPNTIASLQGLKSLSLTAGELADLGKIATTLKIGSIADMGANLAALNTLISRLTDGDVNPLKGDIGTSPVS